jgi:hypothetical protein
MAAYWKRMARGMGSVAANKIYHRSHGRISSLVLSSFAFVPRYLILKTVKNDVLYLF